MKGSLLILRQTDLGLNLRRFPLHHAPLKVTSQLPAVNGQNQIKPDENGEYTFENIIIQPNDTQTFYDGTQKIAELIHRNGELTINLLTDKQVKLFTDITANRCSINAKGPVYMHAKLNIKSALSIDAAALYLANNVTCDGAVDIKVKEGVGIGAPLSAKTLTVDAAYINQQADVNASEYYDVSALAYQQQGSVKTSTPNLRMITEQCELSGELSIAKQCFLVSHMLVVGNNTSETTINITGNNHVHVGNCDIKGDAQLNINRGDETQESRFIVDNTLKTGIQSIVDFHNTAIDIGTIIHSGEITTENCVVEIDNFQQHGDISAKQSDITIYQRFRQRDDAHTSVEQSEFNCYRAAISGGDFVIDNSDYVGDELNIFSGSFSLKNDSALDISKSLLIGKNASYCFDQSQATVEHELTLNGQGEIKNSNIEATILNAYENRLSIEDSMLKTTTRIACAKGAKIQKARLYSADLQLKGHLDIDDVRMCSRKLTFDTAQATINKCVATVELLSLKGSQESGQVKFTNSHLEAIRIIESGHVTLDKTFLIGYSKSKSSHDIKGHLDLKSSEFIACGDQIHSLSEGQLSLKDHSALYSRRIVNDAVITADKSTIYTESLYQREGASLTAMTSRIIAKKRVFSRAGECKLEENSTLATKNAYMGGRLTLKSNSVLAAYKKLTTMRDSVTNSEDSTIVTQKLVALGKVDLVNSLLCADELRIYDEFTAAKQTRLLVEDKVSLLRDAKAKVSDSQLITKTLQSCGELIAEDSVVVVENDMELARNSRTVIKGETFVTAENIQLAGDLESHAKHITTESKDGEEAKEEKHVPMVTVKHHLEVAESAHVTGDDLNMEVHWADNAGKFSLTGTLYARGSEFHNTGTLESDTLFMGFDDSVFNTGGSIFAKNATIHSNFFNVFGEVNVKQRLATSGFINVNAGLILANNYTSDSLLSLSAGLTLPNFSADPKYIFSVSNLTSFGKTALTTALPGYSSAINLAFMVPGLYGSGSNLYSTYQRYGWDEIKSMRRHELMPLVCQVKSAGVLGYGAIGTARGLGSSFHKAKGDTKTKNGSTTKPKSADSNIDWYKHGKQALTLVGGSLMGSHTSNSLININMGANFGMNTSATDLLHVNTGVEYSLFSHNINTWCLANSGLSGGGRASFQAYSTFNSGVMSGRDQLYIKTDYMHNFASGNIHGSNANLTIGTLQQDGKLSLQTGSAAIKHFKDSEGSSTHFDRVVAKGNTFELHGDLDAKDTSFDYDVQFSTAATAHLATDNVKIKTHDFCCAFFHLN